MKIKEESTANAEGMPINAAVVASAVEQSPIFINVSARLLNSIGPNAQEMALATIKDTTRSCVCAFLAVRAKASVKAVEIPISLKNREAVKA